MENKSGRISKKKTSSERRGRRSLHSLVAGFKSVTTIKYDADFNKNEKQSLWQTSFFDEIIKNDAHLYKVRKYIMENSFKWTLDKYY